VVNSIAAHSSVTALFHRSCKFELFALRLDVVFDVYSTPHELRSVSVAKIKAETMLDKITTAYHLQLRFEHLPERVQILWQSWWA
jgi:hypothetical protein